MSKTFLLLIVSVVQWSRGHRRRLKTGGGRCVGSILGPGTDRLSLGGKKNLKSGVGRNDRDC